MRRDVDRALQMTKWVVAAILAWWGTWPGLMQALLILQVLDVAGGLIIASRHNDPKERISSRRFGDGWKRKVYMWILILAVRTMEIYLVGYLPPVVGAIQPAAIVTVGFIFMEGISIVENGIKLGLAVPRWLVTMLAEGHKRFSADTLDEVAGAKQQGGTRG